MRSPFDPKPWYNPKRDGSLEKFLEMYDGESAFPLFKGYRHYRMLWDRGYLVPQWSVIRLMWNVGRDDEHYYVLGELSLEGIDAPAHAGKPGTHDPKVILGPRSPPFEAHRLSHEPVRRRPIKTII